MSVNLDSNIVRSGCGVWNNSGTYKRWTVSDSTPGKPSMPTHYLYKINEDGTGEIYANSTTAPYTPEKKGFFKLKFLPVSLGQHTGNIETTSNADQEETAIVTGTCVKKIDSKYNFNVNAAVRWDQLSQRIYNNPNYVEELMSANPHISLEYRKNLVLPYPCQIYAPSKEEINKISEVINQGGSFPEWMYK